MKSAKCLGGGLRFSNKPVSNWTGKKIKRVAGEDEGQMIVRIPDIVGIAPIAVEPQLRVIALHREHVQVAIGIGNV